MALVKIKELRALSDEELTSAIADTKRELFDLRFKKATRQLETGFHQFKHNRRKLAQLMTIERERELAAIETAAQASQTETTVQKTAAQPETATQTAEEE
ncbi:MAG: 50S ribosomal protein L29 [Cyanobacteria bacterium P01_D01_bin.1]